MDSEFEKTYLRANVPAIVENCIIHSLWWNEPIFAARDHAVEHVRTFHYAEPDRLEDAVNSMLEKVLSSPESFRRFLNDRRKTWVRPVFQTTKQYLREIYETSMTEEELRLWCRNHLLIA